jgi:hypothetical protein
MYLLLFFSHTILVVIKRNTLQNQFEQVLLNLYVKQDKEVVSYLTPLTGYGAPLCITHTSNTIMIFSNLSCRITREILDAHGIPLEQAIQHVKRQLPRTAILVGQNIAKDVEWLGLKDGEDFGQLMDLTGLFRIYNPKYKSYSVFSQDHLAKTLLQWDVSGTHDAVGDAIKSVRLFNLHQSVQANSDAWKHLCDKLLESNPEPSFAKKNPTFEGVCMGNRKTCTCGAPFFG